MIKKEIRINAPKKIHYAPISCQNYEISYNEYKKKIVQLLIRNISMTKMFLAFLSLIVMALPNCGCCKKTCRPEDQTQCSNNQCDNKRVSGPLSEKEIAWDDSDRQ
jgi:hypothetical protein